MIELTLIRHGQSHSNTQRHLIGGRQPSTPLTNDGYEQARLLGEHLAHHGTHFDEVWHSPAVRTTQTCTTLLDALSYDGPVKSDERLLELSQGDWEGRRRAHVYTADLLSHINQNNHTFRPPGGESQADVEARMHNWFRDEFYEREDGANLRVAVVGHAMAIKCFVRRCIDSSPHVTYRMGINNTGVTRLRYDITGWWLECMNDLSHLANHARLHTQ